ncbi:hypothetical protein ACM01_37640 [Streptomyces viridochromogenes]|uniref:Uncharacterized protein n=1 Tax=Streptomyces viridochromogenes TaxID=1938 RepID=A0A0J8BT99_STRVR|nr:hypothetical protein ACM01_37640 [Streptomyces viridochromogenes]KOG10068.1 hypothetical protein ADK35_38910 [Streptomyces viridochromogenes]
MPDFTSWAGDPGRPRRLIHIRRFRPKSWPGMTSFSQPWATWMTCAGAASISLDAYSKVSGRAVRAGLLGVPIRRSWVLEKMAIS